MSPALLALGHRRTTAERRRDRERTIIACTRELFDERGTIDAQIDDIARRAGINKALIYRHFAGKEELFALTLVDYLTELDERLALVDAPRRVPLSRLRALSEVFVDFCLEYPAFTDCAMSLLRRTGEELFGEITVPVMTTLGTAMGSALERIATILRAGQEAGVFDDMDTDYLANHLYTQTLGSLHMARMGLIVSGAEPGHPAVHRADIGTVRSTAITATLATAVGRNALSVPRTGEKQPVPKKSAQRRSAPKKAAAERAAGRSAPEETTAARQPGPKKAMPEKAVPKKRVAAAAKRSAADRGPVGADGQTGSTGPRSAAPSRSTGVRRSTTSPPSSRTAAAPRAAATRRGEQP